MDDQERVRGGGRGEREEVGHYVVRMCNVQIPGRVIIQSKLEKELLLARI